MTEPHTRIVYKILHRDDWVAAAAAGRYTGSSDDARDGFIHLSTAGQLAGTAAKHFRGTSGLVLVALDASRLGDRLVWEPSRGGELFPHFYGVLDPQGAISIVDLPLDAQGVPVIPKDVQS